MPKERSADDTTGCLATPGNLAYFTSVCAGARVGRRYSAIICGSRQVCKMPLLLASRRRESICPSPQDAPSLAETARRRTPATRQSTFALRRHAKWKLENMKVSCLLDAPHRSLWFHSLHHGLDGVVRMSSFSGKRILKLADGEFASFP